MDAGGAVESLLLEVVSLEHVQHLDERGSSAAGRGHAVDVVAAIGPAHRLAAYRPVGGEVRARDEAAARLHLLLDERRGLALVEPGRSAVGDALQRPRQLGLFEHVAHLVGHAAAAELRDGGGVLLHLRQDFLQRAGQAVGDHDAVAGERDRRRKKPAPGQLAVRLPGHVQPGHGPRDADRQMAVVVPVLVVDAVFQEHRRAGAGGRRLPEVVRHGRTRRRPVEEEAAPADIAGGGMGHREREGGGHRGVDRVAAVPERLDPHLGRHEVLGGHHPVAGPRGHGRGGGETRGGEEQRDRCGTQFHGKGKGYQIMA